MARVSIPRSLARKLKILPPAKKRPKYGNRKTIVDGILFDSKREAETWIKLKALEATGKISGLLRQQKWTLFGWDCNKGEQVAVCVYVSDFVFTENGQLVIGDAKGFRTREYRLKKKWLKLQTGYDIREF